MPARAGCDATGSPVRSDPRCEGSRTAAKTGGHIGRGLGSRRSKAKQSWNDHLNEIRTGVASMKSSQPGCTQNSETLRPMPRWNGGDRGASRARTTAFPTERQVRGTDRRGSCQQLRTACPGTQGRVQPPRQGFPESAGTSQKRKRRAFLKSTHLPSGIRGKKT